MDVTPHSAAPQETAQPRIALLHEACIGPFRPSDVRLEPACTPSYHVPSHVPLGAVSCHGMLPAARARENVKASRVCACESLCVSKTNGR